MLAYVFAPFTPLGRLSLSAYWAFVAPLTVLILAIRWQLKAADQISETWYAVVLFLVWMQFCLLCRRLQDNGWPGLVVLPLAACCAFVLIVDIDPFVLGSDPDEVKETWGLLTQISYVGCGFWAAAWAHAMLIAGDIGENAYGPPFGETADTARQKRADKIRDRVRAEYGGPVQGPADRMTRATTPRPARR